MGEHLPGISLARIASPHVNENFIVRSHLLQELNNPAPQITYVIAPSGYGKSSLAAQWAAQHPETTAWYTASANDSVLDSVFNIIESFRNIIPNYMSQLTDENLNNWTPQEIVRLGCNELSKIDLTYNLILDEAHVLTPEHNCILTALYENAPKNMRILALRPTPPTTAPSPSGPTEFLTLWGPNDLRFTESEIDAFISGKGLDKENLEIKRKLAEINGWPLGVYIVSTSGKFGIIDGSGSPQGSILTSHHLLIDHAVAYLSESYRTILSEFCLLPEIDEEIIKEISDFPMVINVLIRMVEQGQYVSYLGANSKSFVINPMIREALVERLKLNPEEYQDLARRSALALLKKGNDLDALELLEIAEESELLRLTVAGNINRMIFTAKSDYLRKWKHVGAKVNVIGPIAIHQLDAYSDLISGDLSATRLAADRLNRYAESLESSKYVTDDMALFQARLLFASGELRKCADFSSEFLSERVSTDPNFSTKASFILRLGGGAAYLLGDDLKLLAMAHLENALLSGKEKVTPYLQLRPVGLLAELSRGNCKIAGHKTLLEMDLMPELEGICGPYEAAYVLAEVLREQGKTSEAISVLQEPINAAIAFQVWPWVGALLAKRAYIKHQMQNTPDGLSDLRTARSLLLEANVAADAFQIIDRHEIMIRMSMNDVTRVNELLARVEVTPSSTTAFARIIQSKGAEAEKQFALSAPLNMPTVRSQILAEVALGESSLQNPPVALGHLRKALALGMENGYREIFLSRSPQFLNLLLSLATETHTIYIEDLAAEARVRIKRSLENSGQIETPLTKRELEILRNLATGLTIFEISKNLHISHNTMKTHLKSVYRKLQVDGRNTAVSKGKELILI